MKTIHKIILLFVSQYTICNRPLLAQNIGINGTGANAHPSALLDIDAVSTPSLGVLIPRITLQAINVAAPVTSPATSLLVYNTATASTGTNAISPGYYYWDGSKWVRFSYSPSGSSANDWNILGNSGTSSATNFIGTTDAQDLVFRTNNTEKMRVLSNGNVGIGTTAPVTKLHVYSSVGPGAIRNTVDGNYSGIEAYTYNGSGSTHPYFMGLAAKGTSATPTYPLQGEVLSAFIGRDAIDGLTSSTYGGAQVYMFANENFSLANKGTYMSFGTTPNGTNNVNERLRIDHNGNVGIGTPAPASLLTLKRQYSTYTPTDYLFALQAGNGSTRDVLRTYYSNDAGVMEIGYWGMNNQKVVIDGGVFNSHAGVYIYNATGILKTQISGDPLDYTYFNSNNVGIGITAPTVKLDLGGTMLNRGELHFSSDPSTVARWRITPTPTDLAISMLTTGGVGGGNNFVFNSSGAPQVDRLFGQNAGINWFVIDNSLQRLGIGTTAPTQKLEVSNGNIFVNDGALLSQYNSTSGILGHVQLLGKNTSGSFPNKTGYILYNMSDYSSGAYNGFSIWEYYDNDNDGLFCTGTDICQSRFDIRRSTGNVGINNSNPAFKLDVNGTTACIGNVWTSDIRKKQNIQPLQLNGLEIISKLKPVTYEWKKIEDDGMKGIQMGFIAQEIEQIIPSMIVTSDNEEKSKGVKYTELFPILVKGMQEQQQQIETLKQQNNLLLKRLEALEKK